MKLRTLVLTIAILAALALVVALVNRPSAPSVKDARVGQPVAAAALVEQAAVLRLAKEGQTVELKKSAAGAWLVASYYDFPADFDKLSRFVNALADTKIERLVSDQPATLARLGFKDTSVRLLDAAGKTLLDLDLGKTPDTGNGLFFRHAGEGKAYLASLESSIDTKSQNWADTTLLALKPDDIAKVELTLPASSSSAGSFAVLLVAETVAAERASKDAPFVAPGPNGRPLKSAAILTLLTNLATLRFTDTTAPDDPLALAAKVAPRTVKLTTFGGKTATIALGRKPEEKKPKAPALPKPEENKPAATTDATTPPADAPAKPAEPEFDITPAGPVFAFITHGDATAPVNALMAKRAFEIADYIFAALPQKADDLFEQPASPPAGSPAAAPAPAVPAGASGVSIPVP